MISVEASSKKEVRSIQRREQIIQAAMEVFSEKGFHNAKVEEIARTAGIGKGTIYEYFEGKSDIFASMLQTTIKKYGEAVERKLKSEELSWEKVFGVIEVIFDILESHSTMHRLMIQEQSTCFEEFTPIFLKERTKKITQIGNVIERGQKTGEFDTEVDAMIVAEMLLSSIEAIAGSRMMLGEELDVQAAKLQMQVVFAKILRT